MSPTFEAAVEALADLSVPAAVLPYLATLRRLPDEVVLDMATREFYMPDPFTCLCGWVIREAVARAFNTDPETLEANWATPAGQQLSTSDPEDYYGGTHEEWRAIFRGVCHVETLADIELAFLLRVAEAAE